MTKRRDYESAFRKELASHGVERMTFTYQKKHAALSFEWRGSVMVFRYPGSGSDGIHGIRNCLSDLRKAMGVGKVSNKTPVSRARRERGRAKRTNPAQDALWASAA